MTNAEKFLKKGVSAREFREKLAQFIFNELGFYDGTEESIDEVIGDFLDMIEKPTLTEDERVILRNVKWKGYLATHIGRARENKGSFIYVRFENDVEMTYFFDNFFGHLFQFIKERRRILY